MPARAMPYASFSQERMRRDDLHPSPDVSEQVVIKDTCAVSLEALVRMKLVSFRRKDQVHLLDMLESRVDRQQLAHAACPMTCGRVYRS